jgi:hypothetical protein
LRCEDVYAALLKTDLIEIRYLYLACSIGSANPVPQISP